jgi:hypothetical protein
MCARAEQTRALEPRATNNARVTPTGRRSGKQRTRRRWEIHSPNNTVALVVCPLSVPAPPVSYASPTPTRKNGRSAGHRDGCVDSEPPRPKIITQSPVLPPPRASFVSARKSVRTSCGRPFRLSMCFLTSPAIMGSGSLKVSSISFLS